MKRPSQPAPAASKGGAAKKPAAAAAPKKAPRAAKAAAPRTLPARRAVLGLLGGIGSGKSTVSTMLGKLTTVAVVDADALAREALEACARDGRLVDALGAWAVGPDRRPDRKAIAAKAFDQASVLRALERLIHPAVLARIEDAIEDHRAGRGAAVLVLDVPLLMEAGLERRCDELWFVDAPEAVRFARAKARLKLSPDDVRKREAAQTPVDRKRARADVVLDNGGSLGDLEAQVGKALRGLGA